MTAKKVPAVQQAPDDVYSSSFVHPSNLPGHDPLWGLPSFAPLQQTAPDVAANPTTEKES